jgi:CBS domain containing-hemolysin-like protein
MNNVMNLEYVTVGQVMTPRTQLAAASIDSTVEEAKNLMLDEGHLRIPIYEGNLDHVIGILLARDLWKADRKGIVELREVLRDPIFVPESKPVEQLIREMRLQRVKMAVVLDEFGGTAGVVTLEDLIEEIVGEIQDEHELEPLPFEEEAEGEVRVGGGVSLDDFNERFDLNLPIAVYDTVGGFVFGRLGQVAKEGDEVRFEGGLFRVIAMDGRRIDRVAFISDRTGSAVE